MLRKNRLFTPGPTPLLPAAQMAMSAANIHHRTAEFRALYARLLAKLRKLLMGPVVMRAEITPVRERGKATGPNR